MEHISESTAQKVKRQIKIIAGTNEVDVVQIINCTVVSVNKTDRTCIVTPLSGKSDTNIENVGLMVEKNDGELKIPSVGSTVGVVMSTYVDPYVIGWSDLDEWLLTIGTTTIDILNKSIKFGDGSFNGLVKVGELSEKLNQLVAEMQQELVLIATGIAAAGGSYAPGTLSSFTKTDYENTKITHGNT